MKIYRRFLVIEAVLIVLSLGASVAASWPEWAGQAQDRSRLERYAAEDAVVLFDQQRIRLEGGMRVGRWRRVVAILNEDGREHAAVPVALSYFKRYEKIRVWVREAGGRVRQYSEEDGTLFGVSNQKTMDDTQILIIDPPEAGPGSLIALEARLVHEADPPQDLFGIQEAIPVVEKEVFVDARAGWEVEARTYLTENPGPDRVQEQGHWRFTDVPALDTDHGAFAPAPPRITLALGYRAPDGQYPFSAWNDTAEWVSRLFERPAGGAGVTVASTLQSIGSTEDFVGAAGSLARRLRYFAIELGWGGYRPRPPETTLQRGFGDCKDKSLVMIAMLREKQVDAFPLLLIAPSERHVPEELPSPFHFNHAVVAIAWGDREAEPGQMIVENSPVGRLRIYDPTRSDRSAQDISPLYHGAACLLVHPLTTALIHLPGSEPEANRVEVDEDWTLDGEGDLQVQRRVRLYGALRGELEGDGGDWVRPDVLREATLSRLAGMGHRSVRLDVTSVEEDGQAAWTYLTTYGAQQVLGRYGHVRSLRLGPLTDAERIPLPVTRGESRTEYLPVLGSSRQRLVVSFDAAGSVSVPDPIEVSNTLGSVTLSTQVEPGKVIIERELKLVSSEIPPSLHEQARSLRRALVLANRSRLLFEN